MRHALTTSLEIQIWTFKQKYGYRVIRTLENTPLPVLIGPFTFETENGAYLAGLADIQRIRKAVQKFERRAA